MRRRRKRRRRTATTETDEDHDHDDHDYYDDVDDGNDGDDGDGGDGGDDDHHHHHDDDDNDVILSNIFKTSWAAKNCGVCLLALATSIFLGISCCPIGMWLGSMTPSITMFSFSMATRSTQRW